MGSMRYALVRMGIVVVVAAVGCTGGLDGGALRAGARGGTPEDPLDPLPGDRVMRRLTTAEYRQSVTDVLEVESDADLPEDPRYLGSTRVGASRATISPFAVEQYETAARAVARAAFAEPTRARRLTGCAPVGTIDATCARTAVARLGERLFRRPLRDDELVRFTDLTLAAAAHVGDFDGGVALGVSGMLQSPSFLFHVEEGTTIGPTTRRFTGREIAARLASLLWASVPDAALSEAADRGELDTPEGIAAALPRLLADPRARVAVVALLEEHLELDRIHALVPDEGATVGLAAALRAETHRVLTAAIFDEPSTRFRDLFDRDTTFVDATVAAHYGLPAPTGTEPVEVTLPEGRRGILSLGAFLAAHGKGGETSPTLRGLFVRTRLLCESIDPPPPGIATDLDVGTGATARERLRAHATAPACASCHRRMDPIGLGFEQFDGLGVHRTTENGATIDPSGDLDGLPFEDARALGELLRDHPATDRCMMRHMFRAAVGRIEAATEEPELDALTDAWVARGGGVLALFSVLVTSDAFRTFEVQP